MVNVTVELPFVPVLDPPVIVAEVPPTETVNPCDAMKPLALIVALLPTIPLVGLNPLTDC